MNPVKERVDDLAEMSLPHEYVADHGKAVDSELELVSLAGHQVTLSEAITQAERSVIEEALQAVPPRKKACFSNALRLWEFDPRFEYAEGYASLAAHPDLVNEHAWSMLDGEKLVDPTANFAHYYGAVISSEAILTQHTGENFSPEGIVCGRRNYEFLREQGYTR